MAVKLNLLSGPVVVFDAVHKIADCIGLPYFSGFPLGLKSHVLISHDFLSQPGSHVLEANIKTPKEILFCEQTGLYILHTK